MRPVMICLRGSALNAHLNDSRGRLAHERKYSNAFRPKVQASNRASEASSTWFHWRDRFVRSNDRTAAEYSRSRAGSPCHGKPQWTVMHIEIIPTLVAQLRETFEGAAAPDAPTWIVSGNAQSGVFGVIETLSFEQVMRPPALGH